MIRIKRDFYNRYARLVAVTTAISFLHLLTSCGGVIGNIKRYRFSNITRDSLKKVVARVDSVHPELKDFDTIYQEGESELIDGYYHCRIRDGKDDLILVYAYPHAPIDTSIEIALLSGGTYDGIKPLAKDISSSKKREYIRLFEKHFIQYVYEELKK